MKKCRLIIKFLALSMLWAGVTGVCSAQVCVPACDELAGEECFNQKIDYQGGSKPYGPECMVETESSPLCGIFGMGVVYDALGTDGCGDIGGVPVKSAYSIPLAGGGSLVLVFLSALYALFIYRRQCGRKTEGAI